MRTNVPGGLRVVAVRADGTRVAEARLGHGEHPDVVLGAAGWLVDTPVFATVVDDGALEPATACASWTAYALGTEWCPGTPGSATTRWASRTSGSRPTPS